MKKILKTIILGVLGVIVIYNINRVVTRPVSSDDQQVSKTKETTDEGDLEKQTTAQPDLPTGSVDDWNLILVGPKHPLTEDFSADTLTAVPQTAMQLDERIIEPFQQLQDAAAEAGFPLVLVSAYRSISYQEQVFNADVNSNMNQGMTEEEAREQTKLTMTEPGHSEHHTGLAVDIVDVDWQQNYPRTILDQAYAETAGAQWLAEHAREFGFILRYPKGKEDITSITFEPWHFRYVGVEHATFIEEHNLTLEEYIELLKEK